MFLFFLFLFLLFFVFFVLFCFFGGVLFFIFVLFVFFCFVFARDPIDYEWFFNESIWAIDQTPTGTTTSAQSGPGSNDSERVLHISQICMPLMSYPEQADICQDLTQGQMTRRSILVSYSLQEIYSTYFLVLPQVSWYNDINRYICKLFSTYSITHY